MIRSFRSVRSVRSARLVRSARRSTLAVLVAALAAAAASAGPASADKVLTLASHNDAMTIMGRTTPAKDEVHTYWFGEHATRFDMGDKSFVTRIDQKKFYLINHAEKTVSTMDLPFDFKSVGGPEMAQMMEMMAKQMQATVTVTPSDKTGSYGGFACTWSHIDVKMTMMSMGIDSCNSADTPIDLSHFKELQEAFSQLAPNTDWMKEMVEKIHGFPVRSETTANVMGSPVKSWQELKTIEDKSAPDGEYDPPAGYKMVKFDPMAEMQRGRQHP